MHKVDKHVGERLRSRRWLAGMTQSQLGDAVGIRFQQIQKYESGANRISASRLWDLSKALDVPVSFFFEGLSEEDVRNRDIQEYYTDKESMRLLSAYRRLPLHMREKFMDLALSIASEQTETEVQTVAAE